MDDLDLLGKEIYDYVCSCRAGKKGEKFGDARSIGCEYEKLVDEAKQFYRNMAEFMKNRQ